MGHAGASTISRRSLKFLESYTCRVARMGTFLPRDPQDPLIKGIDTMDQMRAPTPTTV